MNLEELKDVERTAERALASVEGERRDFLRARKEEAEREADTLYAEQIRLAHEARIAAAQAVLAEKESLAASGQGAPYPIGTKLYLWERVSPHRWSSEPGPWKVIATGVLEAITRQSDHPANSASYSRASVGDYVVRLHKKDGSTGTRYDTRIKRHWTTEGWYPDGVNPPKEPTEEATPEGGGRE